MTWTWGTLDRKTAILGAAGVAAILLLRFVVLADRSPEVVTASESVPMAEKRLERLRQIAATVPGKEAVMKLATSELESREKGILKAETSSQAQAQLQDMLHRLGQLNGIDIRGSEDQRVRLLGNDYGEASVTVRFGCLIEQLVNLLAALAAQPELVSTNQIQVNGGPDKNKVIQVRLTLSGVVAKKLAQEKKAGGWFMNRKLVLLNVVLAAVVVYGGMQLRGAYQAEKAREAALKAKRFAVLPTPAYTPLANDAPVLPSGYNYVAQKNLFHPSRDPNVPVELPPPPPPPPPMPDLPKYHGQMNLGDGPMAMLVEKPGMAEKAVKPGDAIGQFKLVDVNTNEITFAWTFNGDIARRSLRELADSSQAAAPAADNRPAAAAAPPPPPPVQAAYGPGETTGFGFKTCVPNDTTPEGTVVGGFRKTISKTPFGSACRWDPVK